MRLRTLSSLLLVLLSAACAEPSTNPRGISADSGPDAAKAPPASTAIDVTATIYDRDANGTLLYTRSDDRTGQGFATYTTVNKASSQITTVGGWQLLLLNQTARTIYLVLSSQGIPVPDGYYSASVEVYSRCFDASQNRVNFLTMTAGVPNDNCTFGIDFSSGRTKYKLAMGPDYPGTGHATVTCTAAANGGCTGWTIVSNANGTNGTLANLYHFGNSGSLIFDGVYHNSFAVNLSE